MLLFQKKEGLFPNSQHIGILAEQFTFLEMHEFWLFHKKEGHFPSSQNVGMFTERKDTYQAHQMLA